MQLLVRDRQGHGLAGAEMTLGIGQGGQPHAAALRDHDTGRPKGLEHLDHGLDPNVADGGEDADADGWTNMEEYRWQTSASDPTSRPAARFAYSISDNERLFRVELLTGARSQIGWLGLSGDFQGLAFGQDGVLYAVDVSSDALYRLDLESGRATVIGSLGVNIGSAGLAFDEDNTLWMAAGSTVARLYTGITALTNPGRSPSPRWSRISTPVTQPPEREATRQGHACPATGRRDGRAGSPAGAIGGSTAIPPSLAASAPSENTVQLPARSPAG